jgi:Flp pilus assembly protein TadD
LALQPDLADAYMAQGIYDIYADANQHAALLAFQKAHVLQPQEARISWWIGNALYGLGDIEGAIRSYKQTQLLDPKRPPTQLAGAEMYLHHFAQAEVLYRRALALEPNSWVVLSSLGWLYSYLGDLPKMGELIENASPQIKANPNFVDTVGRYLTYRHDWPAARTLYASAREPENLHAAYYPIEVLRGDVEWYAGDKAAAHAQYERALPLIQTVQKQRPESTRWHAELGWVYARLGRNTDASQQGHLALGADDPTSDVVRHAPHGALVLARIDAQIGRAGEAIDILGALLAEPTGAYISAPLLKLDPTWDPIRKDPRFQALLMKYGSATTVAASRTSTKRE